MAMCPPGKVFEASVLPLSRVRASLTMPRSTGVSRIIGARRSFENIFMLSRVGETCRIGHGSWWMK